MKKILVITSVLVSVLALAPAVVVQAKGGSSGGGRSGGFSSSRSSSTSRSSSSSSSRSSSSTSSKPTSSSRSTSSSTTKPGSTVKTSSGKSVKTSSKKPTNGRYKNQAGITGVDGYSPRFTNGYAAPAGSVVYYPQHSMLDYLPWIYLFSQSSPANDSATIVQPDGKEVVAKPEPEGTDGLAVLNWIILILLGVGAVAGVVYLVNKFTSDY